MTWKGEGAILHVLFLRWWRSLHSKGVPEHSSESDGDSYPIQRREWLVEDHRSSGDDCDPTRDVAHAEGHRAHISHEDEVQHVLEVVRKGGDGVQRERPLLSIATTGGDGEEVLYCARLHWEGATAGTDREDHRNCEK